MSPPNPSTEGLHASYDVVIVGGGQSGMVLANRLSEDVRLKVLLLEAGAPNLNDPMILTPPFARQLWGKDQYDWDFKTEPQKQYEGRQDTQNRGKGLGGTSAINLNMIVFPSQSSIDSWERLGNPGWTFSDMAPYYRKFHTFHEPSPEDQKDLGLDYLEANDHGKTGPIQVGYGKQRTDFDKAWNRTFKNLGYKSQRDPLTGGHFGAYNAPASINPATKTRSYAGSAYYTGEIGQRPNLHIVTEAFVEKLILDQAGTTVSIKGIQFVDKAGNRRMVNSVETILSGGVFGSPQLLELSGIGNPKILEANGIKPIVDLPGVGEGLQDHANVGLSFESEIPTFDSFRDPKVIGAALAEYKENKTGPLTTSVYCASYMPCMSFLDGTDSSGAKDLATLLDKHAATGPSFPAQKQQFDLIRSTVEDPKRSSIEYLLAPVQMAPHQCSAAAHISDEARAANYITIFASLSHPFSRGTSHIKSSDPRVKPAIDPQYFAHPIDAEIVARHLTYISKIVKTEPLASLLVPDGRQIPEGKDMSQIENAREHIKTGYTTYHPCGTCAMMPRELDGVVDPRLRVHGVKGLRVVDASIFPLIPRGNLQSTVYAVAERAADIIKEDLRAR